MFFKKSKQKKKKKKKKKTVQLKDSGILYNIMQIVDCISEHKIKLAQSRSTERNFVD